MNMIFYQGDGDNIKTSLRNMSYNYMRSHHYVLFHLARALGCKNVLDGISGSYSKIIEGTEIFYTLKEFPEYTFKDACLGEFSNSLGVLFHTHIDKKNYSHVMKALKRSTKLIYYCSDFELDDSDYASGKMLLKFIKENPDDPLSLEFRKKCFLIISGFKDVTSDLTNSGFNSIYLPQIINPNIPRITSEKFYDIWMINTNPFYKYVADKLVEKGFKVLSLVQNKDYAPNVDYIELNSGGLSLDFLLSSVSLCKYYLGSYQSSDDPEMISRYSSWNHTSKVLECYYANTYWISSNKTFSQVVNLVASDQYKNQEKFNKVVERDYSFNTYKSNFNSIVEICKEHLKDLM